MNLVDQMNLVEMMKEWQTNDPSLEMKIGVGFIYAVIDHCGGPSNKAEVEAIIVGTRKVNKPSKSTSTWVLKTDEDAWYITIWKGSDKIAELIFLAKGSLFWSAHLFLNGKIEHYTTVIG